MNATTADIRAAMQAERAEPLMTRHQLQRFGITFTWAEWVAQCNYLVPRMLRKGEVECPARTVIADPWLTYWQDGLTAKEAMERVNRRSV
jgi:hypothetical protein